MKTSRQSVILDIIAQEDIETQGQMLEALLARGVKSTQATVSRDIKELRLVKEIGPSGRYRYVQADQDESSEAARRMESAVWGAVDAMGEDAVLGSVAGDDTGIIVMRNAAAAERLCAQLRRAYKR